MSILIFLAAYILFVFFPRRRSWVAVLGSLLLVATGALTLSEAGRAVNWNVIGIYFGTLLVADIFMHSRVPAYLAEVIVDRSRNTAWAILAICALSGFISAFVENVATVMIVAPIALALAKKLEINPVNMLIAIAISSNLQGTATLIGDPPSMLLGGYAKFNFWHFFFYQGRPSVFFAVEIGALASFIALYYLFRRQRQKVKLVPVEKIKSWFPTVLLIVMILALALSSFFDPGFSWLAGTICLAFGLIAVFWALLGRHIAFRTWYRTLDWDTGLFLAGVFILVGALTATGWIEILSEAIVGLIGGDVLIGYLLLLIFSVLVSAFVDNVPYLAAMLPVAMIMSQKLGVNPPLFLFALLIGACLGGNLTPIGASANIVACGLLKKEGHHVGFRQFFKVSLPFTASAVLAASVFVWLIWH